MNHQPQFRVMNPLQTTIEEGEEIIARLSDAAARVERAISDEREWYTRCKDAETAYEVAETDALADIIIMAQQKEGPLAGVAATSKAYDILLSNLKNQLRSGKLAASWQAVERMRRQYDAAKTELEQAQTIFTSMRKVADIKTQVLRASTI
jgi:hypothetical protein